MEDLKVLATEGEFDEYILHAHDVRPRERTKDWKILTSKVANLYSKALAQKAEISLQEYLNIEKMWSWPSIKEEDSFKERRRDIGIRYLTNCLKGPNPCEKHFKDFWENTPKEDAETAFKLAQLANSLDQFIIPTWSFLDVALKSNQSEFYCQKTFVMNELWKKISIEISKLGENGDLTKKIDEIIHPDCLPFLVQEAKTKLYNPQEGLERETSFQILKSQFKATEEISDFFYSIYLLENPSQGETFNYSWNRMTQLGKKNERREKIIQIFKGLDPFPDQIFGAGDENKKKTIILHLKHHFPEIIDLYISQCLNFYEGVKKFPNGNPTINCSHFMSSEIALRILDREVTNKFNALKKL